MGRGARCEGGEVCAPKAGSVKAKGIVDKRLGKGQNTGLAHATGARLGWVVESSGWGAHYIFLSEKIPEP